MKLNLAKELLSSEATHRMKVLTASIAMEMVALAEVRLRNAHLLPIGNSKPTELQKEEALIFDSMMATIDGKSNAEQRAAKMAILLATNEGYQALTKCVATVIHNVETHEVQLKGYKMEWQVIQENMMNLRSAAAILEGINDVEIKKGRKPKKESMPESLLTPEQHD